MRNTPGAVLEELEHGAGSSYGATMWQRFQDGTRKAYAWLLEIVHHALCSCRYLNEAFGIISAASLSKHSFLLGPDGTSSLGLFGDTNRDSRLASHVCLDAS